MKQLKSDEYLSSIYLTEVSKKDIMGGLKHVAENPRLQPGVDVLDMGIDPSNLEYPIYDFVVEKFNDNRVDELYKFFNVVYLRPDTWVYFYKQGTYGDSEAGVRVILSNKKEIAEILELTTDIFDDKNRYLGTEFIDKRPQRNISKTINEIFDALNKKFDTKL